MSDFKDSYGAEIGMVVTCQHCGKSVFLAQIGYNNLDAAFANRHSFLDQFEPIPEGWKIKHDLGGWHCPQCLEEYNAMIEKFQSKYIRSED